MNYARFYALLNRLPVHDADMKERLVLKYTKGRTASLRGMSGAEYNTMCNALDGLLKDSWSVQQDQLRKHRSPALKLMQRLGIDTTDWARINAFCRDGRIAGKEFAALSVEELQRLTTKLRGIERAGGLKPMQEKPKPSPTYVPAPHPIVLCMPDPDKIC